MAPIRSGNVFYLDATDQSGGLCQIVIDEDTAVRERDRDLFSMTSVPRGDCPAHPRSTPGWQPLKRSE